MLQDELDFHYRRSIVECLELRPFQGETEASMTLHVPRQEVVYCVNHRCLFSLPNPILLLVSDPLHLSISDILS